MSLILGLQTGHESSAVLFEDGRLLAAVSDERLSRIKNDGGKLSDLAIDEVLRLAGHKRSEVERIALQTAEESLHLNMSIDRTTLCANGQDLAFIVVEAVDKTGRIHPQADQSVRYSISGPATIAAIGSADLTTTEPYNANPRRLYQGRSLIILRTTTDTGKIILTASVPGMKKHSVTLISVTPP